MDVRVVGTKVSHFPNLGRYFFAELTAGRHAITISISEREVRVITTSNASHRAWGGMGRTFPSISAALDGYKLEPIRAMINAADHANLQLLVDELRLAELNAEAAAIDQGVN